MYIKPAQSLTQGCVGQHMFHSQNDSQQKTDVCFRNLPAPAGKILAVATGVTAGPANLGRMTSWLAGLTGGTRIIITHEATGHQLVINYTKQRH